jgi:hypothetical protein
MMYYIQGLYGGKEDVQRGNRCMASTTFPTLYRSVIGSLTRAGGSFTNDYPCIHQPVGIAEFPGDLTYYSAKSVLENILVRAGANR